MRVDGGRFLGLIAVLAAFCLPAWGCPMTDPAVRSDKGGSGAPPPYRMRICPPPGFYEDQFEFSNDAKPFKSLFMPESLAYWDDTRRVVDCVSTYGLVFQSQYDWGDPEEPGFIGDVRDELFRCMDSLGIELSVECECLVHEDWGIVLSAADAFQRWAPGWRDMESHGATISQLTIDESFRRMDQHPREGLDPAETAHELADYIRSIHEELGDHVRVVVMEPYPYFGYGQLTFRLDLLDEALLEIGEGPLDGFLLDPDWHSFYETPADGSWRGVLEIEQYCRDEGIPFGLVYWPSAACEQDPQGRDVSDSQWYHEVMFQGGEYEDAGGRPDEYVIMSWLWAPRSIVREDMRNTFMTTVHDFYEACVAGRSRPSRS